MSDLDTAATRGAAHTGARRVFKWLRRRELATIKHDLHGFPVTDVYELTVFDAVTSADEMSLITPVQFYVYHSSDAVAAIRKPDGTVDRVKVEETHDPYHIPFADALRMVGMKVDPQQHLGDVMVEFWDALFAAPSDRFDETSYGISPWIERDVGDRRTVGSVSPGRGAEWNNLRFRFRPRKTLNWPTGVWTSQTAVELTDEQRRQIAAGTAFGHGAPPGVEVVQLDLDTVGLRLLDGARESVGVMVLLRP
ncbi:MAG: hypothetical protein ACJ8J0_24210 [Longimicrobiaceae bacterium]